MGKVDFSDSIERYNRQMRVNVELTVTENRDRLDKTRIPTPTRRWNNYKKQYL